MFDPTVTDIDAADGALLDRFQRAAFDYFLEAVNPENGLVADTTRPNAPASIAVVGFALSSYPIAVERGWMTRTAAADITLTTLRFLWASPQGRGALDSGYKGFFYHFLDMEAGRRAWRCELSTIDTALLIAGALVSGAYFHRDSEKESEIRWLVEALYLRVDWRWAQGRATGMRLGWKPESGFLPYIWQGYNEAIILCLLALGSPSHPVPESAYRAWASSYRRESIYGLDVLYGGPFFMHQFSHAWIDFEGIRDSFMRQEDSDYFVNSCRAASIQREYGRRNPNGYEGFSESLWGLWACDGPGRFTARIKGRSRRFLGYAARGAPFGPDDGTIALGSCLASMPFAPDICMSALRHICDRYPFLVEDFRMPSAFNPTLAHVRGFDGRGWISDGYYGLDQGIAVMMIENHRSRLIWNLMRTNRHFHTGLTKAGFEGGWLCAAADHNAVTA